MKTPIRTLLFLLLAPLAPAALLAQATAFVGLLKGLAGVCGSAVLLVAHPSLTGMSKGSGLSGSTSWNNSVRSRLYLDRIKDGDHEPDPNRRRLTVLKANYGPAGAEIGLTWQDGVFVAGAPETGIDRTAGNAKAERVFKALEAALRPELRQHPERDRDGQVLLVLLRGQRRVEAPERVDGLVRGLPRRRCDPNREPSAADVQERDHAGREDPVDALPGVVPVQDLRPAPVAEHGVPPLLAEAEIPYDRLVEMDDINPEMGHVDVALVVGANDVVNPAARHDKSSPIFGMPIIDADKAQTVLAIKRSMNPGFAGIDNDLYYANNTLMLFGDAKQVVGDVVKQLTGEGGH